MAHRLSGLRTQHQDLSPHVARTAMNLVPAGPCRARLPRRGYAGELRERQGKSSLGVGYEQAGGSELYLTHV